MPYWHAVYLLRAGKIWRRKQMQFPAVPLLLAVKESDYRECDSCVTSARYYLPVQAGNPMHDASQQTPRNAAFVFA
jgi:hypothetical protein